jgi:WD40 repeat protein
VALALWMPSAAHADGKALTDRVGDALPDGAVVRFGTLRFRTPRRTTAFAVSADGKLLANGTATGVIEIWDVATGRIVHQLKPPPPEDADEEEDEGDLDGPEPIADLAFDPGGKRIAAAVDNRAIVWTLDPAEAQTPLVAKSPMLAVTFGPRGRVLLAAGADKETYVWDIDSGEIALRLQGHGADVTDLALAGKGKLLVSVGRDGAVLSYKAGGWGEAKLNLPAAHGGAGIETVAASRDGKLLATGASDGRVILWDLRRKKALKTIEVSPAPIDHVVFGAKGRAIYVVAGAEIHVFGKDGGRRQKISTVGATRVGLDGSGRVFGGGDGIEVFDADTGTNMLGSIGHRGPVRALTFANGGKFVASGGDGDELRVWEAQTGHELQVLPGHVGVMSLAVSADSGHVVVGARSKSVHVWNLLQGTEQARLGGHRGLVTAVAYAPSGKLVGSGGTDASVRIWSLEDGKVKQSFLGDKGHARSMAWSPDGRLVAAGLHKRWYSDDDESVVVWHVDTGSRQFRLPMGDAAVISVAFSPDSRTLAAACADGSIRLIDTRSGAETGRLDGHTGHVRAVAYSPDGKLLASGGSDGTARIWDTTSKAQTRKLEGHVSAVYAVAFSPDSGTVATASADSTVLLWRLGDE